MTTDIVLLTTYNSDSGTVEFVESTVPDEFQILLEDLESSLNDETTYIEFLKLLNQSKYTKLHEITKNYNYCVNLSGAYQDFKIFKHHYSVELAEKDDSNKVPKYGLEKFYRNQKFKCRVLLDHLDHTVAAYNLEKVYKYAEDDKNIIAYSHRKRGWSFPIREVRSNFKFRFKTNFGYGRKAHFYLQVIFNDIKYKSKPLFEISEYSDTYKVHEESWVEINSVLARMYDDSKNQDLFVEKYIVDECNLMINGVQKLLEDDKFEFIDEKKININPEDISHSIIETRGVKVVGILHMFNESVIKCPYLNSESVLIKILEMAKIIVPILDNELSILEEKLNSLQSELKKNLSIIQNELNHIPNLIKDLISFIKTKTYRVPAHHSDLASVYRYAFFEGRNEDKNAYDEYMKLIQKNSILKSRVKSLDTVSKKILDSFTTLNETLDEL